MEDIILLCNEFFSKYVDFTHTVEINKENSSRLSDVEFIIADKSNKIKYDYDNNAIIISREFINNKNFKFEFYKTLLNLIATKKENNVDIVGISYSNKNKIKNEQFNNMLSSYICNAITGEDINDIGRVFMPKIERLIKPHELVNIYLNNDLLTLTSRFSEYGIDFDELSKNIDILYKNYENSSDIGTIIDKMLIDGIIKKDVNNNAITDYSNIEITKGVVVDQLGFEGIEHNKTYYYNSIKNHLINNNPAKTF